MSQEVDRAQFAAGVGHKRVDLRLLGHVAGAANRFAAQCPDFGDDLFRCLATRGISDRDVGSSAGQLQSGRTADPREPPVTRATRFSNSAGMPTILFARSSSRIWLNGTLC